MREAIRDEGGNQRSSAEVIRGQALHTLALEHLFSMRKAIRGHQQRSSAEVIRGQALHTLALEHLFSMREAIRGHHQRSSPLLCVLRRLARTQLALEHALHRRHLELLGLEELSLALQLGRGRPCRELGVGTRRLRSQGVHLGGGGRGAVVSPKEPW